MSSRRDDTAGLVRKSGAGGSCRQAGSVEEREVGLGGRERVVPSDLLRGGGPGARWPVSAPSCSSSSSSSLHSYHSIPCLPTATLSLSRARHRGSLLWSARSLHRHSQQQMHDQHTLMSTNPRSSSQNNLRLPCTLILTTLNMIFSVTYYLELRDAITVYFVTNHVRIGCLDTIEH